MIKFIQRQCRSVVTKFQEWRKCRFWRKRHLAFLRAMISSDARWLSVDPVTKELTERYEKALSDEWYTHSFEDSSTLRQRLGLEPSYTASEFKYPERKIKNSGISGEFFFATTPPFNKAPLLTSTDNEKKK